MRTWRAACAASCAAVLAANVALLRVPRTPAWDDAWYLELSFRLFYALKSFKLASAAAIFASAFRIKAPLIIVLPLPLYVVLGPSEGIAPWANQPLLVLTWYAVYRIGRALYSENAGWAAAAVCALTPILYGLSRYFMVETLLTALTACLVWAAVEARPRDGRDELRGALLGLGLLAKSIFPLYILGPVWMSRRALVPGWKRSLAVALAVAATWYAFNLVYVVGFALSAGFGSIGRDYGSYSAVAVAHFGATILRDGLSWPGAAALLVLFAASALSRKKAPTAPADRLIASWLALPLFAVAFGVNKDVRYVAPALPALAVAAGAAAAALPRRAGPALAALLLAPLGMLALQTAGLAQPLLYNGPSRESGWDRAALVDAVSRHAGPRSVVAVALEDRLLNANNLASLSAAEGRPASFINLGYAQPSADGALIRLKDKGADMLVLVDGDPDGEPPAFLNRADDGLRWMVEAGKLRAALLESGPVAQGVSFRLYAIKP